MSLPSSFHTGHWTDTFPPGRLVRTPKNSQHCCFNCSDRTAASITSCSIHQIELKNVSHNGAHTDLHINHAWQDFFHTRYLGHLIKVLEQNAPHNWRESKNLQWTTKTM